MSLSALALDLLEQRAKLLWCQLDLSQDLADERSGKIAARMVRHCSGLAVRVTEEDMAASLPHGGEAQVEQHRLHRAEVD